MHETIIFFLLLKVEFNTYNRWATISFDWAINSALISSSAGNNKTSCALIK
jgi:hypothetical protein